jgi:hypothetical protein
MTFKRLFLGILFVISILYAQSDTVKRNSNLGLEALLMVDYSLITSDNAVSQAGVINSSNGVGYNLGIGLRWQIKKFLSWRNGVNFRMKRFHSTYTTQDALFNQYSTQEYGNLHYFGIYSALHFELNNFIIGAGVDFSFAYFYRADYNVKNSSGTVVYDGTNQDQSIIAKKDGVNSFNMQLDINLILGYKIKLAKGAFNITPILQFTGSTIPMFNISGIPNSNNRSGVYGLLINGGLIVDFGFGPRLKKISLLDD